MDEKIKTYVETYLSGYSTPLRIIVGLSGGADSISLVHALNKLGIEVIPVHVNFKLRGIDSAHDASFVKKWCKKNKIKLFSTAFDTTKIAKEQKRNIEDTARNLRYNYFWEIGVQQNAFGIATAHHLNDQAETILLHLTRGSGLQGAAGILPVSDFKINFENNRSIKLLRPLLDISRQEIEEYIKKYNLSFVTDTSNKKIALSRNRIRHKVIPQLEKINPKAVNHLGAFASRIQSILPAYSDWIDSLKTKHLSIQESKIVFSPTTLLRFELWYPILAEFGFNEDQLVFMHLVWASKLKGKKFLSSSHKAIIIQDAIEFIPNNKTTSTINYSIYNIPFQCSAVDHLITIKQITYPKLFDHQKSYIKPIPFNNLILRNWKPGDYMKPLGMGGKRKKIKDILTDAKISGQARSDAIVLIADEEIIWLSTANRISENVKVSNKLNEVWEISSLPKKPLRK